MTEIDTAALRAAAEKNCPADVREWGQRHGIPVFAEATWQDGYIAGGRALLDRLAAAELDVARADSLAHGYTDEIAQTHTRATAAEARAERLAVVVEKARAQFAFYAEQHRAKRTEDGDRKARVNDEMVAMCVAALAAEPAGEREGGA